MQIAVLRKRSPNKGEILSGLYSSKKKAKIAAVGLMLHLDKMVAKPGKWSVDEREHEIHYSRPDGFVIVIDFWTVDKALIDGVYKVI